ncbi:MULTISPECIES: hypothetical protein [Tetragenococcus]|uniref:Transposase n=1 Tax=Tetragenococcus halophilus (strain DSM 20338 / JCM 20259 / NCIMB 9735 / NBRC 12172) TaxID=945021 RepID=A0AAN1SFG8_TETHN|nr:MULTISPECIES: hypothetical protein [Tetragenococcus]MDN6129850.1 hypothetical protein [Tetragenococcus halophilus]MDN6142031.1 hypothetical protein [Tetragenococcus halophilus]MDN6143053.1 hypothetical protein [Tetragenococcus halophilus]BAK93524.1 putative transposase [Tetragenococcus halophilus NBRC 12172]GBD70676.1 putative transposase [Tetragenococcus halophilus subsp. halophilus]
MKYNDRSSIERVNIYMKEYYELSDSQFYKLDHTSFLSLDPADLQRPNLCQIVRL